MGGAANAGRPSCLRDPIPWESDLFGFQKWEECESGTSLCVDFLNAVSYNIFCIIMGNLSKYEK